MKEQKTCFIRTRYLVKHNGSVCAKIVNGGGTEYTTCLHRNGAHSCDCKAGERGVLCYHVKHLQAKEAERREQHVEKPVPAVVKTNRAETVENAPISAQVGKGQAEAGTRGCYGYRGEDAERATNRQPAIPVDEIGRVCRPQPSPQSD